VVFLRAAIVEVIFFIKRQDYLRYCSSLTCSIQSTTLPSSFS
jgi:hypothetical protein